MVQFSHVLCCFKYRMDSTEILLLKLSRTVVFAHTICATYALRSKEFPVQKASSYAISSQRHLLFNMTIQLQGLK